MDLPDYILKARTNGSDERLRSMANMHGMDFKSTERIYNTRIAHEATEYAREHGKVNEFHKVVFRKVYADGFDISKWDVLRSAAEEVGLDADDMQSVVDSGKYTAEVAEQVRHAQQIGVTGVPTYVINDRYAIVGAQPYESFKSALAQIANMKQ
jgi:predicted DsbA family dithiol-disulfide isomerase